MTALDWAIIVDTLNGSIGIIDGGKMFHYTVEARKVALDKVTKMLGEIEVEL